MIEGCATTHSAPASESQVLRAENRELRARLELVEAENRMLLKRITELVELLAGESNKDRQLALQLEIKILQSRLNQRNRERFAKKSEKRGRPDDGSEPEKAPPKRKKRTGSARTKQPDLPRTHVRHLLDAADQACPDCGGKLHAKGDRVESSERIQVTERKYTVVVDEKQVYGCGCGHTETALAPVQLVPGGRYDTSVAIQAAVDKYTDHQPLNRQVSAMRRAGLRTSRQAMWDQIDALATLLEQNYLALHTWMLKEHKLLHADETSWRMMAKGGSSRWWMWALAAKDGFFCMAMPSRNTESGRQLLRDYAGALMADAYIVYTKLAAEAGQAMLALSDERPWQPEFDLFTCWSHARRPFEQAATDDSDADVILDLIAALYEIEARAKELAASNQVSLTTMRAELRASESADIIAEINRWRTTQFALPKTKIADGLGFLDNQWAGLTGFLNNPLVPLDNNLAERAVRTPVLGRKNHLGSHSPRGARVSSLFYSLLGSCRLVGVSQNQYLTTLVQRCLRDPGYIMLPHEYAAEVAAAKSAAAATPEVAAVESG